MNTTTLFWIINFYQPVGNFDHIITDYIQNVCKPFLHSLEQAESVELTLHFDAALLEKITTQFPDVASLLYRLCAKEQVELMGGSYYESILGMFGEEDGLKQIEKMSNLIHEAYNQRVLGAWLAESQWEPRYALLLHRKGIRYTVLEDSLFMKAGCRPIDLYEVYRTEYQGSEIAVIPYLRSWLRLDLRQSLSEAKSLLMQASHRPYSQIMAMVQRAEHYFGGGVPRSITGGDEVLQEWLTFLTNERSWVRTRRAGAYIVEPRRLWTVYLPEGCAHDVQKRTLLTESQVEYERCLNEISKRFDRDRFLNFMHVGTWNGFLRKYPEVNRMHKRLLYLSGELRAMEHIEGREALEEHLLRAQCHTTFWHGDLDGCYANYFRNYVYEQILKVEKALIGEGQAAPSIVRLDLDRDGVEEVRFRAGDLQMIVRPGYGGSVCELSELGLAYHVTNTFRRRREAYHYHQNELYSSVIEDWYERHLFQEHFVSLDTTLEDFEKCQFVEYGDFIDQPFEVEEVVQGLHYCGASLVRRGGIYSFGRSQELICRKRYQVRSEGVVRVDYQLENKSPGHIDCQWILELNYSFLDGGHPQRVLEIDGREHLGNELIECEQVSEWNLYDRSKGLFWKWRADQAVGVWHFPVYTIGPDPSVRNYQGSALLLRQRINLGGGEKKLWGVEFALGKITY
jgi:hypothetical protein